MPNVVVYVKAKDAEGFDSPRALAEFVRAAVRAALDERGKGMVSGEIPERIEASSLIPKHPPRSSSADTFRPDPKPGKRK